MHSPAGGPPEDTPKTTGKIAVKTLELALLYVKKGLSVIPLKPKDKKPMLKSWKEYQQRLPTEEELRRWFKNKETNIAIITGKVSGNLVVIDFDSREAFENFVRRVKKAGKRLQFAISNTWIVESGKGFHIYLRLPRAELLPSTKVRFTEGIDLKAEGGYVVAPPSVHPSGKRYEFVKTDEEILGPPDIEEPITLDEEEWNELLTLLGYRDKVKEIKESRTLSLRELKDEDLLKLKELLKGAWVRGQRQFLALYLSGWMAKAMVHPVSVAKLFKLIAEENGDEEFEDRLSTIYYSYRKHLGNLKALEELDKVIEEWKSQGIIRRNVSKGINIGFQRIRGKGGVQEILERSLGEERALEVIREIEELLGISSPYADSVITIMDYEKQVYAIANLHKKLVVRARRVDNGKRSKLVYKEKVFEGVPVKVTVYSNPLGGPTKFEVVWEANTRPRPKTIGPATVDDIIEILKKDGLVINKRFASDVLSAILNAYIKRGKAEIKEEIEAPGFYWLNGKLEAVRIELSEVRHDELKDALLLLSELANWFDHTIKKFATVIKWGVVAPFIYAMKQKGKWVPWLYLYGASHTGKTTLGEVVLSIWGLGSKHRKTGANIDTIPRLGHVLSQSTFPILINEPGNVINKEDVVEAMKNAIESTTVRGKFIRGDYVEIPSLSPLIMASNKALPRDDALLRRLIVISFTYGERISKEKAREFERDVKPRLNELKVIGMWITKKILGKPSLLELSWEELGEKLLKEAYEEAGLKVPDWVREKYEEEVDVYDELREQIRILLAREFENVYRSSIGKIAIEENLYKAAWEAQPEERIRIVLENRLLPWAYLCNDLVCFTSGLAKLLEKEVGNLGGLKGLAELLGWRYGVVKRNKKSTRVAMVPFNELITFLFP